eukprot:3730156-Heterocapsa_arctica.AAC.1
MQTRHNQTKPNATRRYKDNNQHQRNWVGGTCSRSKCCPDSTDSLARAAHHDRELLEDISQVDMEDPLGRADLPEELLQGIQPRVCIEALLQDAQEHRLLELPDGLLVGLVQVPKPESSGRALRQLHEVQDILSLIGSHGDLDLPPHTQLLDVARHGNLQLRAPRDAIVDGGRQPEHACIVARLRCEPSHQELDRIELLDKQFQL